MSGAPDRTFDPREPGCPIVLGRKIVALYYLERGSVAAFDAEDGSHGLLLTPQGRTHMPGYANHYRVRESGGVQVWPGADAGVPLYEKPDWALAYEQKTGRRAPDAPTWYREELRANGRLPFTSAYDVERALGRQGWRSKQVVAGNSVEVNLIKRFGSIWVTLQGFGGRRLFLDSASPRGLSEAQWEEFRARVVREIPDLTHTSVDEIERAAAEVVVEAKAFTPQRKQADNSHVWWRDSRGQAALDAWKLDVEASTLDILSPSGGYRQDRGYTTHWIVDNLLTKYGFGGIVGVPRDRLAEMVRNILDKLAKSGRIEKDTNEPRNPLWWPARSGR